LNRDASPLQAATPIVIIANAATRSHDRERSKSTTQDMVHTLRNTSVELTPRR
jgi:hypothetical protein